MGVHLRRVVFLMKKAPRITFFSRLFSFQECGKWYKYYPISTSLSRFRETRRHLTRFEESCTINGKCEQMQGRRCDLSRERALEKTKNCLSAAPALAFRTCLPAAMPQKFSDSRKVQPVVKPQVLGRRRFSQPSVPYTNKKAVISGFSLTRGAAVPEKGSKRDV